MESKVIQFESQESKPSKTNTLKLTVYNLQSFLISGGLTKSDYIFLMLRLIHGCSQDVTVDLAEFAGILSCYGVTALGVDKKVNFTVEDVQVELAKLAKKGLLTTYETPIQLKITDVQ